MLSNKSMPPNLPFLIRPLTSMQSLACLCATSPWASACKGMAGAGAALSAGARAAAGSGWPVGMPPSRPVDLSLRVEPARMPLCASVREWSSATSWPPIMTMSLWPLMASFLTLALVQQRASSARAYALHEATVSDRNTMMSTPHSLPIFSGCCRRTKIPDSLSPARRLRR
jgi:hypothetical protein